MALTLRLASPSLPPTTSSTIFVPFDATFRRRGPLPLSLLQYHIIPSKITLHYLTYLPISTQLPTFLPNSPFTITSSYPHLSINNVTVPTTTPLFIKPSLLILPIHDFFNSSSLSLPKPPPESLLQILGILQSNNCSITAALFEKLSSEKPSFGAKKLTIFAPSDESLRNVTDYDITIFRKHVVNRLITWRDLIRLPNDTLLSILFEGFDIRVSVFPRLRLVNGVKIVVPNMYRGEFVVVHGVEGLLD
ncbi:putative fasciclin-like arabinogalactan protein 20 [Vicia villosa]|uniref:putative fasciclin-like arabinogalactan protein 20 n=1 Tax=Vicia villosa TaxID=3911 RepID=UPI00273C00A4|nr:putative fasciclin-like arabinogalactan protein 20 [Vicia villosa]